MCSLLVFQKVMTSRTTSSKNKTLTKVGIYFCSTNKLSNQKILIRTRFYFPRARLWYPLNLFIILLFPSHSHIILTPINLNSTAFAWGHFLVSIRMDLITAFFTPDVVFYFVLICNGIHNN
jgi:hypothetical protein